MNEKDMRYRAQKKEISTAMVPLPAGSDGLFFAFFAVKKSPN
jgi:hypothetical protein